MFVHWCNDYQALAFTFNLQIVYFNTDVLMHVRFFNIERQKLPAEAVFI